MNPIEFQRKWIGVELKERSASQEHFLDICRVLDHATPAEMDPTGDFFTFEGSAAAYGSKDGDEPAAGRPVEFRNGLLCGVGDDSFHYGPSHV